MTTYNHYSVLLDEAVELLVGDVEGLYVDATFGRGGHTKLLLDRLQNGARVVGIDKDLAAVQVGQALAASDDRFAMIHDSFANLASYSADQFAGGVDGILMDLGVSSPQLDDAQRGFSFQKDGPLDMRMDTTKGQSAAQWVADTPFAEMVRVFKEYGEERFAKRIARVIVEQRELGSIDTTKRLSDIVTAANPKWERDKHPATRVFQAIRIAVNNELEDLEQALIAALHVLKPGGRLVVISFHSLEDRIVKRFFKKMSTGEQLPKEIPVQYQDERTYLKLVSKAVKATQQELSENIRSRSAVLRAAERTGTVYDGT